MRNFLEWVWTLAVLLVIYISIFIVAEIFGQLGNIGCHMWECL